MINIRKDIDALTHEVTFLKEDAAKYARIRELEQTLSVYKSNQEQYTDEKIKELRKDVNVSIATSLEPLQRVPQATDYVLRRDHKAFVTQFYTLAEQVEKMQDTLMMGYQTHKDHVMDSKVTRTEVEDLVEDKFDNERGKAIENDQKECNKRVNDVEGIVSSLEHKILQLQSQLASSEE